MGEDKETTLRDYLIKVMEGKQAGLSIRSRSGKQYDGTLTEVHATFIVIGYHLLMIDAIESIFVLPDVERPREGDIPPPPKPPNPPKPSMRDRG